MAIKKDHKVVSALPSPLEANSVYYVRVGAGFDLYVTNSFGELTAFKLNAQLAVERPQYTPAFTAEDTLLKLRHITYGVVQAFTVDNSPLNLMVINNGG